MMQELSEYYRKLSNDTDMLCADTDVGFIRKSPLSALLCSASSLDSLFLNSPCPVLSLPALSCPALLCPALFCPALPYSALPCPAPPALPCWPASAKPPPCGPTVSLLSFTLPSLRQHQPILLWPTPPCLQPPAPPPSSACPPLPPGLPWACYVLLWHAHAG